MLFRSIRTNLMNSLNNYKNEYKIISCGHSLGGALAVLFAFEYKCDCLTVGAPRVGDKRFKELFNKNVKNVLCIINEFDPIPKVPKIGYKHVTKGYSIFTNNYKNNNKCFLCKKTFSDINSHKLDFYIENTKYDKINTFINTKYV